MSRLKQNNLEESTTDIGFIKVINENKGETIVALQKEIELEDGTTVIVESITPSKMKQVLNSMVDGNEGAITYETPGEEYEGRDGVVQIYNDSVIAPDLVSIEITTEPTKTVYTEGETFDSTGMVVTGHYSNETSKEISDYTVSPSEALTLEDTIVTISYEGKTTNISITVEEDLINSIAITTEPTKVSYTEGETLDITGLVVSATFASGKTEVLDNSELTFVPTLETQLTTEDTSVTVSYYELSASFNITVNGE